MTTPECPSTPYRPAAAGLGAGLLGWLQGLIATPTPAYRGDGQPAPRAGGVFGTTPAYRTPPPDEPTSTTATPMSASAPANGQAASSAVPTAVAAKPATTEAMSPASEAAVPASPVPHCTQAPVTIVIAAD